MGTLEAKDLEARIAKGESYLARNPDDAEAKALYWRLTDELVRIRVIEEDLMYYASLVDGSGRDTFGIIQRPK